MFVYNMQSLTFCVRSLVIQVRLYNCSQTANSMHLDLQTQTRACWTEPGHQNGEGDLSRADLSILETADLLGFLDTSRIYREWSKKKANK